MASPNVRHYAGSEAPRQMCPYCKMPQPGPHMLVDCPGDGEAIRAALKALTERVEELEDEIEELRVELDAD